MEAHIFNTLKKLSVNKERQYFCIQNDIFPEFVPSYGYLFKSNNDCFDALRTTIKKSTLFEQHPQISHLYRLSQSSYDHYSDRQEPTNVHNSPSSLSSFFPPSGSMDQKLSHPESIVAVNGSTADLNSDISNNDEIFIALNQKIKDITSNIDNIDREISQKIKIHKSLLENYNNNQHQQQSRYPTNDMKTLTKSEVELGSMIEVKKEINDENHSSPDLAIGKLNRSESGSSQASSTVEVTKQQTDKNTKKKVPKTEVWCHQCKKRSSHYIQCLNSVCKKKYCKNCVKRHYNLAYKELKKQLKTNHKTWFCYCCKNVCLCASCRRKRGDFVPKKNLKKRTNADMVDDMSQFEQEQFNAIKHRKLNHHRQDQSTTAMNNDVNQLISTTNIRISDLINAHLLNVGERVEIVGMDCVGVILTDGYIMKEKTSDIYIGLKEYVEKNLGIEYNSDCVDKIICNGKAFKIYLDKFSLAKSQLTIFQKVSTKAARLFL